MQTLQNNTNTITPGKKYKFVVNSAEQAVSVIRENLGESAKVISVNQVNGKGLARFISAPQLEIIAMVPEKEEKEAVDPIEQEARASIISSDSVNKLDFPKDDIKIDDIIEPVKLTTTQVNKLFNLLVRYGFEEKLLLGIQSAEEWSKLDSVPLSTAMDTIIAWFRNQYNMLKKVPTTQRIAFIGTAGVGKTTALCKKIARDVLVESREVQVLKLDSEAPNPDDALNTFCEILGVEVLKGENIKDYLVEDKTLYVDIPGVSIHNSGEWSLLTNRLDSLEIETRVLIVNAVYDIQQLKETFNMAKYIGATHFVLSHVDELQSAAKLWTLVLGFNLSPLFLSKGQNIAGDLSEDFLSYLIEYTFPRI